MLLQYLFIMRIILFLFVYIYNYLLFNPMDGGHVIEQLGITIR